MEIGNINQIQGVLLDEPPYDVIKKIGAARNQPKFLNEGFLGAWGACETGKSRVVVVGWVAVEIDATHINGLKCRITYSEAIVLVERGRARQIRKSEVDRRNEAAKIDLIRIRLDGEGSGGVFATRIGIERAGRRALAGDPNACCDAP